MDERGEVPVLAVRDLARAVAALREVLGLVVLQDLGWMALVGEPGGARMLVVAEDTVGDLAAGAEPAVVRVA